MRKPRLEEVVMCPQIILVVSSETEIRNPEEWHFQLFREPIEEDKGRADSFSLCQKDVDGIITNKVLSEFGHKSRKTSS